MKNRLLVLMSLLVFAFPLTGQAKILDIAAKRVGTLTGRIITEDGVNLPGGVVSFFNTEKGIPPLIGKIHRIPDMVGKMNKEGKFSVKLMPGSYYMGALVITDPKRGPGPPRDGEIFYYARNDNGVLFEVSIEAQEVKDAGDIVVALPETFPSAKDLITIEGRLLKDDGSPFAGGVVLVKTDMNKARPEFVSKRTGDDGSYRLTLPAGARYYLLGRERTVGRPMPGTYVGTYGSAKSISEGGALPFSGAQQAKPAGGKPMQEQAVEPQEKEQAAAVFGKAGETLTGYDIIMFRVPVPEEEREKFQGTLGFEKRFNALEKGTEQNQTQSTKE